jgi:hypothetical protein
MKQVRSKPKARVIMVRDLTNQTGLTGANGPRAFLLCRTCGGEYSANAGDYFMLPDNHVMQCCGKPVTRVIARTVYQEVA